MGIIIPPVSMHFIITRGEQDLLEHVKRQEPEAMFIIAKSVIKVLQSFGRDRASSMYLLERGIAIRRSADVTSVFVKSVMDDRKQRRRLTGDDRGGNGRDGWHHADVNGTAVDEVQYTLAVVDRLWCNEPVRRLDDRRVWYAREQRRERWLERVRASVIYVEWRTVPMDNIHNQVVTWWSTGDDATSDIQLYDSARIDDCSVWAMAVLDRQVV